MSFEAFAALTIHDVKNRLAALAGRAEARGDGETLREALDAAARLTALLVCYRAERGWQGADIDAHVPEDLLDDLAAQAARLSATPVHTEAGPLEGLFFYDETLVRMTLDNALQNALRHSRGEVRLSARADEQWLEFTVEDDGEGYPADLLTGTGQPPALSGEGTGLGLHLARLVAGLHTHAGKEASVTLANRAQGGARFTLRLPR
jgi:signal transduction histidine kinase